MKTLEESLPSCCGPEHLADDVLIARSRDKTDSVSSDASSSTSSTSSSPSSSCNEQEEGKHSSALEQEEGEPMNGLEEEDSKHYEEEECNEKTPAPSTHRMTMRRRSEREYNLRSSSIINRIQTEQRQQQPRQPKPKAKPPPLSKYRRRTANSRERGRMREINDAFEVLRLAIPSYPSEQTGVKLTKITTLRLALNYIGALREMLGYDDSTPGIVINNADDLGSAGSSSTGSSATGSDTGCVSPDSLRADSVVPSTLHNNNQTVVSPTSSDATMDLSPDPCFSFLDSEGESVHS